MNRLYLYLFHLLLFFQVTGQTYDFNVEPSVDDNFTNALFRIYIPENIDTIRGVIHLVSQFNKDSREKTNDTIYQSLCNQLGFSLLGSQLDSRDFAGGVGDALLKSLDTFSVRSNHPELKNAPIFFNGHSWGGQWAYDFALWKPDRVIGLLTHKGGYHTTGDAGEAIHVPCYMFIGEEDRDYRITNLTGIFNENRPKGAPWTIAVEPDSGHSSVKDTSILFPYIRKIVKLRLPNEISLVGGVSLNKLALEEGWFGNRSSYLIGSINCFLGETKYDSWLPDKNTAIKWQSFVSGGKYNNYTMEVAINYNSLSVINPADEYQWINCNSNYSIIPGETNQSFIPYESGNYAAIITSNNCIDTSDCITVTVTSSFIQNDLGNSLKVFPNPTEGKLTIDLGEVYSVIDFELLNICGQKQKSKRFKSTDNITIDIDGKSGFYLIKIKTSSDKTVVLKVMKK